MTGTLYGVDDCVYRVHTNLIGGVLISNTMRAVIIDDGGEEVVAE